MKEAKGGVLSWWTVITHLCWTLLGVSEESDHMTSVDVPSETLARLLYATFLIFGAILLINMLIALLSNTYQRTLDNSFKEWSIKRAISIQTYEGYDPIPVPLNIIYSIGKLIVGVKEKEKGKIQPDVYIIDLVEKYFAKHPNLFPITDWLPNSALAHSKDAYVRSMYYAPAWADFDQCIRIEGLLLTCECMESCQPDDPDKHNCHGARHWQSFSSEYPYFEVAILETGEKRCLGVGVVTEEYSTEIMPGWENRSVGYHIDDGIIYHDTIEIETKGPAVARRGDRIRCTVMIENKREIDGKVPVVFTLNGKKIIMENGEEQIFMDADKPLYPFIAMTDGCIALVKMCSREDLDSKVAQSMFEENDRYARKIRVINCRT
ncbi:hypothetical protein OS493_012612 [Desmophyllum pertusum]|uniref:SPRY domain-containing protein n=1 Tax=Desmophyllum pertusum TaxID=174260 RepID=A0A9X0CY53_9CNID|nr:hypothetical protein OS493_012612 [Desmophyllum pertusum]